MFKKVALILIGLTLLTAGAVQATAPQSAVLPFYFVTGTVRDADTGATVANRQVIFCRDEAGFVAGQYITASSNSAGVYQLNAFELNMIFGLPVVAGGEFKLVVNGDKGTVEGVTLDPAAGYVVKDLSLISGGGLGGGSIRVKVVSAGKPITNASVSILGQQAVLEETTYLLSNLSPGNYQVHAAANGYVPNSASVTLAQGEKKDITITLDSLLPGQAVVYGYVTDAISALGLGGASLSFAGPLSYQTASYGDGWYQQLVNAGVYDVSASLSPYVTSTESGVNTPDQSSSRLDFALSLPPGTKVGAIAGKVSSILSTAGIAGATVSDGVREVKTLSDGSYSITNVPAETYYMVAYANEYVPAYASALVQDQATTTVNFTLTALEPGKAAVLGKVRAHTGTALVGAGVNLSGAGSYNTESGFNGTYEVININTGDYQLTAARSGYLPQSKSESFAVGEVKKVDFILSPPEGTVPLTIWRDGANLKVEWDSAYGIPALYVLTGNGNGVYTDTADTWVGPVTNGEDYNLAVGVLTHSNQVGGGIAEVYYKGIINQSEKAVRLPSAQAVGKVNVGIYGGKKYNLLSTPFLENKTLRDTFSESISQNGIEVYVYSNLNQAYQMSYYEGSWSWPGTAGEPVVGRGIPLWIYNPNNDLTVTLVGSVPQSSGYANTFYKGKKYNIFSLPTCLGGTLLSKGLMPADGAEVYWFNNETQAYASSYYDVGSWKENIQLQIGVGGWYYNGTAADVEFSPNN